MKILALIPARAGSKRLPGKNVRRLGNKPLINWSIDVCKAIQTVDNVLVSTDDEVTRRIAIQAGAMAPWLRPADLSSDETSTVEVAMHALTWYESCYGAPDALMLLQPTSPFRSRDTVLRGIQTFIQNGFNCVVGVSPAEPHPMWCFKLESEKLIPLFQEGLQIRSQELPPMYVANGAFYLVTPEHLRVHQSFYSKHSTPLIINSRIESLDIDTEFDWKIAEIFQKELSEKGK